MAVREAAERRPRYRAGVAAALGAEAVFVAVTAAVAGLRGMDPWMVVRMPGSLVLGPGAEQPPGFVADEAAVGVATHLVLGVVVGLVYAALLPRLGISPLAGGLAAGAVLYVLGFWLLPLAFPGWLSPFRLPPREQAVEAVIHAVYGVALGLLFRSAVRGR